MVIAHQKELKASGSMLVDDQRMFNAASRLIEVAGLYNPEKYFADPSKEPPQQPKPPSPDEQMVQINTRMVEVQKMAEELKHQREMLAIQEKSLADNRKLQAKVAELEAKLKKDGMDDEFRKQELLIRSEVDLAKSFPSELGDANRQQDEARSLL
jgi:outer membrane biosynthesis protein TonB